MIQKAARQYPGEGSVADIYESFELENRTGTRHRCMVMEVLGPTLEAYVSSMTYRFRHAQAIAYDCCLAVSSLHDFGVCIGDLDTHNIALDTAHMEVPTSDEEVERIYGNPSSQLITVQAEPGTSLPPGVPSTILLPASLGEEYFLARNPDLAPTARIIDVGSAFVGTPRAGARYHRRTAAPEVLSADEPTMKSDIWALGVVIFFLLTGRHMAEIFSTNHYDGDEALGEEASQDGVVRFSRWGTTARRQELTRTIGLVYPSSPAYVDAACNLLLRLLEGSPTLRPEAMELLNNDPFLLGLECCRTSPKDGGGRSPSSESDDMSGSSFPSVNSHTLAGITLSELVALDALVSNDQI